MKTQVKYS